MSILETIRKDSLTARKMGLSTSGMLSALIGEINLKEKSFSPARPITDAEIVMLVKSFINNIDTTLGKLQVMPDRASDIEKLTAERVALVVYMPPQMTAEDIEAFTRERMTPTTKKKDIMTALKEERQGAYDGKLASEIVDRVIAEGQV